MGTSNFHNENATRIYADECDYEGAYEDLVENVKYSLLAKDKDRKIEFTFDDDIILGTELRSFPARSIGTVYETFDFLNIDLEVQIIALARSGYYEGVNLDYEINIQANGTDYEDVTGLISDIQDYPDDFDTTPGLIAIHAGNLQNKIEKSLETLITETEETFAEFTMPLVVTAQFSNGETFYEAA